MMELIVALMIFASIVGILTLVAIVFGIVYGVRRLTYALKGEPYVPLFGSKSKPEYQHQGVETGATLNSVRSVLKQYAHVEAVGPYARAGMDAISNCERKTANFYAVLDTKFQPGSLSWDKFSAAAGATEQALLRNCSVLANAVQVFDADDYHRLKQAQRRSTFRKDAQLDEAQIERMRLFESKLADMQTFLNANDQILYELDKLSAELNKLDDAGLTAESERLIEEIRTLIDETKYYKQQQ